MSVAPPLSAPGDPAQPLDVEGRFDLRLAGLARVMEARHAELVARTTSQLDAVKASMDAALSAVEKRMAEHVQRVERVAASAAARDRHIDALEERLSASIRDALRQMEARSDQLDGEAEALRTDLLAAMADQVEVRGEELHQREVARELALESRLRSELDASVASQLDGRRTTEETLHALSERIDGADAQLARITGELARIQTQLAAMQDGEVREDMDRLSNSLEAHRAETATRSDLVALEDRVAKELASTQSDVHARLTTLDAVVAAVDAAAANLDTRLVERLTGVASTALAPVRSDLRAVHDEVAATQKSVRELRRRMQTLLPPPAAVGAEPPPSKRAGPRKAESPGQGPAG
ncbi:MAG: hypothetical protein M3326_07825 [Actinomycetota bacterium]|nr:hypothetical protein [Actinomycetota bacterium]